MKKMFYLIFLLLCLPIMVNADMAAPYLIPYDAEITNPEGAPSYEWSSSQDKYVPTDKKIPYGTKVQVSYEMSDNDLVTIEYEDIVYDIRMEDITIIKDSYKVNKNNLVKHKAIVLKDLAMRKGPAYAYSYAGATIKKGEEITIYNLQEEEMYTAWVYVEYKNTTGYVSILNASVAFDYFDDEMLVGTNATLKDSNGHETIIPANTIIKGGYNVDAWTRGYYVEYNGTKGVVDMNEVGFRNASYKVLKDTKLYEKASATSKIIGTVKKGTILNRPYEINLYPPIRVYYEDGNTKGWIIESFDEDSEDNSVLEVIEKHYEVLKDIPLFDSVYENAKQVGTIKKGNIISLTYNCRITDTKFNCYYSEKDNSGEIVFKGSNVSEIVKEYLKSTDEEPTVEPTPNTTKKTEKKPSTKPENFALICVMGGVIVCLTGVVIVLLINKKKKTQ